MQVVELANEIKFKDSLINELTEQISTLRKELGVTQTVKNSIFEEMKQPTTLKSLILVADRQHNIPGQKDIKLRNLSPIMQYIIDAKKSTGEEKKIVEEKKPITMHKMGSRNMKKL